MALAPTHSGIVATAQSALSSGWRAVQGLFTARDYTPEATLAATPGIDARFLPRVPMNAANIDVSTLQQLGSMGMKRGREITAETHPDLYYVWSAMAARAGMKRVPQLILTESNSLNAITLSREEVALTTGLLQHMDFREVTAILGHELGHGSSDHNRPRVLSMALFGGGGVLAGNHLAHRNGLGAYIKQDVANPGFLRKAGGWLFGRGDRPLSLLGNLLYLSAGATVGSVVANQVAVRPTELDADRKGAAISGDPEALISAFTKLEKFDQRSGPKKFLSYLKSGYPSMHTRIEHLRGLPVAPILASLPVSAPSVTPIVATKDAPSPQVHGVAQAARVDASVQTPTLP